MAPLRARSLSASIFEKSRMSLRMPSRLLGRRMGDADVLVRLRRKVGLERQTGHVDDRVHRRADLVAHVRQERSLRPIRLHGLLAGRDDGSMGHLLRGDGGVKGPAELAQFAALVTKPRYRASRSPAPTLRAVARIGRTSRRNSASPTSHAMNRHSIVAIARSPRLRASAAFMRPDRAPARSRG